MLGRHSQSENRFAIAPSVQTELDLRGLTLNGYDGGGGGGLALAVAATRARMWRRGRDYDDNDQHRR